VCGRGAKCFSFVSAFTPFPCQPSPPCPPLCPSPPASPPSPRGHFPTSFLLFSTSPEQPFSNSTLAPLFSPSKRFLFYRISQYKTKRKLETKTATKESLDYPRNTKNITDVRLPVQPFRNIQHANIVCLVLRFTIAPLTCIQTDLPQKKILAEIFFMLLQNSFFSLAARYIFLYNKHLFFTSRKKKSCTKKKKSSNKKKLFCHWAYINKKILGIRKHFCETFRRQAYGLGRHKQHHIYREVRLSSS